MRTSVILLVQNAIVDVQDVLRHTLLKQRTNQSMNHFMCRVNTYQAEVCRFLYSDRLTYIDLCKYVSFVLSRRRGRFRWKMNIEVYIAVVFPNLFLISLGAFL